MIAELVTVKRFDIKIFIRLMRLRLSNAYKFQHFKIASLAFDVVVGTLRVVVNRSRNRLVYMQTKRQVQRVRPSSLVLSENAGNNINQLFTCHLIISTSFE